MKTRFIKLLGAAAAMMLSLGGTGIVHAAPLAPGQTIAGSAESDPTGGTVLAGGVAVPFATAPGPGAFSGTLNTTVIANDPSNPFGGLTFTYKITNDSTSLSSLERMTNLDFTGWLTDVSYQSPVAGTAPTTVDRDASGTTIGWNFSPLGSGKIAPDQASALLVVQTNAHDFAPVTANIIDGSTGVAASFGPVPEPASLALICLPLLGLSRRR